jgi:hypothetical protein
MDEWDEADQPNWDAERAAWLVGKYVLAGITRLAADGKTVISMDQFHGVIECVVQNVGVTISCRGERDGETITLPPATEAFEDARPGDYRLRSTGETISDPDVTTSWTIKEPAN